MQKISTDTFASGCESDPNRRFMDAALDLADTSCVKGNHPFGAVLVLDGNIILAAENTVNSDSDCTAHAELNLVRSACKVLDAQTRRSAILYSSTEPCAMCAGAIYWSGIRSVAFGCAAEDLAKFATGSFVVPCLEIFAKGREPTYVRWPFCDERAKSQHEGFWRTRPANSYHSRV